MKIKCSGNTTNMRAHLTRHHPELALAEDANAKPAPPKNQPTLDTLSLTKLPPNSERAKKNYLSHRLLHVQRPAPIQRCGK